MKTRHILAVLLIILMVLAGCAPASREAAPMEAPSAPMLGVAPAQDSGAGFLAESDQSLSTTSSVDLGNDQRIVIRNASLTIVVVDPGRSLDAIGHMAEAMGGYIVSSDLHRAYTRNGIEVPEAYITVRVPAERLSDALAQIKAQVQDAENDILNENVTGQDVTKEYTDLNSQLRNLEDAEAQLREIMASATKTEDVLAIFQQLTQVRRDIEVLKGQIKYYEESASLSSISVQLQAQEAVQPLQVGGWKPVGTARNAVQALIDTLQFLAKAAIWIIIFILPVSLIVFGPLVLLIWLIRRGMKNRKKQPPAATPPAVPPTAN